MLKYVLRVFTALLCVMGVASAQSVQSTYTVNPQNGQTSPQLVAGHVILCPGSGGAAVPCVFNTGGSGGGAVTQSGNWQVNLGFGGTTVGPNNLLGVSDAALDALISGGALKVLDSGSVGVTSLPALPAGSNAIGNVGITSLPALPAGSNAIGNVGVTSLPALPAGSNAIGNVGVTSLPALPAGPNAIGSVTVSNLPPGAATAAAQATTRAPTSPAAATATQAELAACTGNGGGATFTAGQQGTVSCDLTGRLLVDNTAPIPAGTATIGFVNLAAAASGGATISTTINVASSNMATNLKAAAAGLYGYTVCNTGSAAVYFRLFNTAAAPTVGTTVATLSDIVPASGCTRFSNDLGVAFATGLSFDVTTTNLTTADTTAIASAGQVSATVLFK